MFMWPRAAVCFTPLILVAATLGLASAPEPVKAQEVSSRTTHALSLIGEPKYPADYAHFDYVNPAAPKGGRLRQAVPGSFDSLNPFVVKGVPGAITPIYETLMSNSMDEPGAEYGLIAKTVTYPEDYSWVEFDLHPQARWHDGEPLTAADVIFSFEALTKNHPHFAGYYANVTKAEALNDHRVRFEFDETGNRELPQIMGQLYVLPEHYWDGSDGRDIASSTLVPPLGSGPYRLVTVDAGRRLVFERVEDYWARDLPVNVGKHNFDRLIYDYYLEETAMVEAFKGDNYDFRIENSAKRWATEYDFDAVKDGRVVLQTFTTQSAAPMQAFIFNLRRDKFSDPRVRQAFNLAFDYEWMNKNIFFSQYARTDSFFEGSELEATGLPGPIELELLEPLRDQVPPEVFTTDYENPVNGDPAAVRANLRTATALLQEAGWGITDGKLTKNDTGEKLTVEFLLVSPTFERVVLPYKQSLERLGIDSTIRVVDTSQYQARVDTFDYDIIVNSFAQSLSPGNEQRDFWGSASADREGSRNRIGIKNPAVDALIEKIIFAPDRETLIAASRALDRVLLWNHYVVPQWWSPLRTARWDRFGLPETLPAHAAAGGFPDIWWYEEGAAATAAANTQASE
ncbi:extracellular solute-binding protein [Pyruvatibacter sp.]|uniref:extracellular solute-binding protein n=1 Tax=Pyruvatibacter sp. TaxID=1981328 RepID=UPI0032EBF0DE